MLSPSDETTLAKIIADYRAGRLVDVTGHLLTKTVLGGQTVLGTRPMAFLTSGSGTSGTGSASALCPSTEQFIGYVYRTDCVGGVNVRYRASMYQTIRSIVPGYPCAVVGVRQSAYAIESTQGCCACPGSGSASGSSSGPTSGSSSSSGGGAITPEGCSCSYPSTIHGTWTAATGDCAACFTGSFALVWDGVGKWAGNMCTGLVELTVVCFGGDPLFTLAISSGCGTSGITPGQSLTCGQYPVFTGLGITGCCTGTVTLTFSA